ncbi:MAG: c-type cytochrome, partial [bacterium]
AVDIDENKLDTVPTLNPFVHGDATRGKTLFADAGCPSCHTVGEQKSVSPGPDLTEIGAYRNWAWLAESIIDPNAEIGSNWKYTTIYLKPAKNSFRKEKIVFGFLRENSEEQVKIVNDRNQLETFSGDQVKRVEASTVSKMPTNYSEILTFQQMSDLLSYLQTLKDSE